MKTASIIGHFGNGSDQLSGQIVKTEIVTKEIENKFGAKKIQRIDTKGGLKTLLKAPFQTIFAIKSSKNIIIMTAQNALRIYVPLISCFRHMFAKRKFHYIVIGGWLPEFLRTRPRLARRLMAFDKIYVEAVAMKKALEDYGFKNIVIMPNCKNLHILGETELVFSSGEPLKLCTFSRVMKEKGIETAAKAVTEVNKQYDRTVFALDIYGRVESEQEEWFSALKGQFPEYIRYCGAVPYDKSVDVLKYYYALLFPTHFYTEGIPGTVIDAFAAGVPVIASRWENFSDMIEDKVTGIGYNIDDEKGLKDILLYLAENKEELNAMKSRCLVKVKEYLPENSLKILLDIL